MTTIAVATIAIAVVVGTIEMLLIFTTNLASTLSVHKWMRMGSQ